MKSSEKPIILARVPLLPLEKVREIFSLSGPEELEFYIRNLLKEEKIREALSSLNPRFTSQISDTKEWRSKELQTLAFYILRMSYRPTPLAMVAGVAKLNIGKETTFLKNDSWKIETFNDPDHSLEASATSQFRRKFQTLTYLTNPSMILKGKTSWYIDWEDSNENRRFFRSKAVLGKEGKVLLKFCQSPRSFDELKDFFRVSEDDLDGFLEFLAEYISGNLLEVDVHPSLIQKGKITKNGKSGRPNAFTQVKISLAEDEIAESQIRGVNKAIRALYRISKPWSDHFSPWFSVLKDEFRRHYRGRYIPLLDFLLLHLPESDERLEEDLPESPTARKWVALLSEASLRGKDEIELTEELLNELELPAPLNSRGYPVPAYSVVYSLGREDGQYRGKIIFAVQGWEGVRGYSRFSRIHRDIRLPGSPGSDQDKIFVDLEFYPGGGIANGINRREESLSSFVRISHVKAGGTRNYIDLASIEVSLQNDLFILRCRDTGKQIVPLITSAHIVHAHEHPVFRFFGFLGVEGTKAFLNLPWPMDAIPYLPAVTYRGFQLSARRWRMRAGMLLSIAEDPELQREMRLPRWVVVRQQDNVMPIDLGSPMSGFLLRKYSPDSILHIEEEWHLTQSAHLTVAGRTYSHELVTQWKSSDVPGVDSPRLNVPSVKVSSSKDEIRSYHFFVPSEVMDTFLLEELLPLAKRLSRSRKIKGYYFIKYPHPSSHIRFRVFSSNSSSSWENFFLTAFQKAQSYLLQEASEVPFELELETYGGRSGLDHYHEISQALSASYPSYHNLRAELASTGHFTYGNPVDVAYLFILFQKLSSHPTFSGCRGIFLTTLPSEVKRGRAHFLKHHRDLLTDESLSRYCDQLLKKLAPVLGRLGRDFSARKIKVDREFFLSRIIHMEVFRIMPASPNFVEAVSLSLLEKLPR